MPLVALLLDPDDARRAAQADRLRAAGHAVVTASDPGDVDGGSPPDVVLIPGDLPAAAGEVLRMHLPDTPVLITREGDDPLPRLAELARAGARALVQLTGARVDLRGRRVFTAAGSEELTEKESALLAWLVAHADQTVTREDLLVHVWGYRPDMQTRTVDNTVRRLRVKVERDPAEPDHVHTVRGEGYRFVWGGVAPFTPAVVERPASPPIDRPAAMELVGRDDAIAEVAALLQLGKRVITLLGPPGIGKTTLATRVASATSGAVFCSLVEARTPDDVLLAAASAIGVPLSGVDPGTVGRALSARGPVLVVVDNAEQVCDAVAELIGAWRGAAPEARFLVTSRVRLRLGDEHCFDLPPLDESAALDLFVQRASARRRGFGDSAEELEDAASVVRLLEGIPLALELAASRMRVLSPADLVERLQASFDVLRDDRRGRTPRQTTLSGAIGSSWDLLAEADRLALARLSVFRGGFDADAAEAVLERHDALDAVEHLVDHSLVRVPRGGRSRRFTLYEAVREYAFDRLAADDAEHARARHAHHFLERGRRLREQADGPRWASVLDALEADRGNVRAAFSYLLPRRTALAGDLLLTLSPLWEARGAPPPELRLLEEAVSAVTEPLAARADLLTALALERGREGRWRAAEARVAEAAPLLGRDLSDEVRARFWLASGQVRGAIGELDEAVQALSRVCDAPDAAWRVRGLQALAILHRARGDRNGAMRWVRDARRIAHEHGLERLTTSLEATAGSILLVTNQPRAAIEALERALPGLRRSGSRVSEIRALGNIAIARSMIGQLGPAVEGLEHCLNQARSLAHLELEGKLLYQLGRVYHRAGDHVAALDALDEGIARAERSGAALERGLATLDRGRTLLDVGRLEEAASELEDALSRFEALDLDRVAVVCWLNLGRAREARGDLDGASSAWHRVLDADPSPNAPAEAMGRLALLSWWRGDRSGALSRIAEAEVALGDTPHPLTGLRVRMWAGFVLADLGRLDEASERFDQARAIEDGRYPEERETIAAFAQRLRAAREGAALPEVEVALSAAASDRADVRLAVRLVRRALSG